MVGIVDRILFGIVLRIVVETEKLSEILLVTTSVIEFEIVSEALFEIVSKIVVSSNIEFKINSVFSSI